MPAFQFTGPVPYVYPETRDAAGAPLGTVEPGDRREFDQAPDHQWAPASDPGSGGDDPAGGTGDDPPPDGPQPAPPAVIPGA